MQAYERQVDVLGRQLRQGASQAQDHDRGTQSLLEHLQAAEQVGFPQLLHLLLGWMVHRS